MSQITIDNHCHLHHSNVTNAISGYLSSNQKFFKVLFVSKDFRSYASKEIQGNLEQIIRKDGLAAICFFGPGATQLEQLTDHIITNWWMEKNDDSILSILTMSEDDIKEDGLLHNFISVRVTGKDDPEHPTESIILYDDKDLEKLFSSLFE